MKGYIIPQDAFNDNSNPRASDYKTQGTNKEPLKFSIIEPFLNNLQKDGELKIYDHNFKLSKIAYKVINKF